jgi:hypothetical protein
MAGELQVAAALLLVFFLPGFTLIRVLFPRKEDLNPEYGLLYQVALGMVLSLVLVVLLGFVLTSFTDAATGRGYFEAGNLWAALSGMTLIFFVIGWWRGAYPVLGRIHPRLLRVPPSIDDTLPRDQKIAAEYRRLALERQRLLRDARMHERLVAREFGEAREHHILARRGRLEEIAEVDSKLRRLRDGIVEDEPPAKSKRSGAES